LQTERYGDFSLGLHQRVVAHRIPITGTIEISRRCPLACAHCYNNLPMSDRAAQLGELTFDEHCRILDEISEAGCFWLLFTGGEIFARKDFLEIYTYAKKKGFLITLFTNGTLITPKIADYLSEWPPFSIEITLYGRTKATYEKLTQVPGSYDRCIRGIQLLKERGLPLKLKTVGVSINKHEIGEMKQFAEQELGLEFKFDAMINPRIDCSQSPLAVRLKPHEVVELDLQDADRMSEWQKFGEQFVGPVHSAETSDELYHCGGGINSFAIDPYGMLSICVLSQIDQYDLRKGSFKQGWEKFLFQVRHGKKITVLSKCVKCEIKSMCGMCPANGELENGHAEKPVDFLCHVAHLRAHAFDFPIKPHGECEYCAGGSAYSDLMQSVDALNKKPRLDLHQSNLNIEKQSHSNSCSTGGCSSCGLASVHHP
jgi:radical SAM protein with 4Fe4S-binding SPASM domain